MLRRVLVTLTALLIIATTAWAQSGTVAGSVADTTAGRLPGATIELVGQGDRQTTQSDADGQYTFANVPQGTYDVTVSLVGFAQARQTGVMVGDGPVDLGTITLALAAVSDTIVVSASRNEVALVDAPATMSIVDQTVLASSPAQNYGDLLRGVPGLNVIQLSARDINLTSRQATGTLTNSQLVLLDGRSLYLDFFGLVLWDFLPNNIGDIRQIEVIRGPASAVWGANALTGVVNVITKSPREAPGTDVSLSAGILNRNAGSGRGKGVGGLFGANISTAQVINDTWSYRASAGYFASDPLPRPVGRIPVIADPRAAGLTVGGASYPLDAQGPIGTAFQNRGTSQPKFDLRFDQELSDRNAHLTYQGGVAGTEGIIYTGLGPFDMQPGSFMGYAKVNYSRQALFVNAFTNIVDAEAPNLLLTDPVTSLPLQLNFSTQTYDLAVGDARPIGSRQVISVGGNVRRNNFDLTVAPSSKNRTEMGAYIEDNIFLNRVNLTLGARVDKFGNLDDPVFSPRMSATFKLRPNHAIRASFNRAFRSPSMVNNYLETSIVNPVDLSALALLNPQLAPLVADPFPLVVRAVGSELPIGGAQQTPLKEEQLTAYELAYTGTLNDKTTVGLAYYVNELDNSVNFAQLPATLDPYTAANPPPGWRLPPAVLTLMASRGIFLPRTAFTYLNLGPIRQQGLELSMDHRFTAGLSMSANYSWQGEPKVLDDPDPYPTAELALPPTHRFNASVNFDGSKYLGSASLNYSDGAFWSDVLTSNFHGFTDSYTLVNGSIGRKWSGGKVTTLVKATNLLNQEIQQHVFGDLLKLSMTFEARLRF